MNSKSVSSELILKIALTINLISVIWNIISDCDETYNYWESLHFLIYGNGFQTWEYSPTYGLRSYLFLIIYGWPAMLFNWIVPSISKRILFFTIRIFMATIISFLEADLYKSLKSFLKPQESSNIPIYSLLIFLFSSGSFISSTAFLPSSFALYCSIFTLSNWLRSNDSLTIAGVALGAIIGWPFSAAIGIPFAIDIVIFRRRGVRFFALHSLFWGLLFSGISFAVDSLFYGRLTLPSLNIVLYNVFGSFGPELYGTAPAAFYVKNYVLNFNFAVLLVLIYPILLIKQRFFHPAQQHAFRLGAMVLSVFVLWNAVFFAQPHKEERFLFPAYVFMAVIGGCGLCEMENIIVAMATRFGSVFKRLPKHSVGVIFFIGFTVVNAARIVAIICSYSAPIGLYSHLSDVATVAKGQTVCVGREWHRFPSHFFVAADVNVSFIRSEFRGQLPSRFSVEGGRLGGSRAVHRHFNERNEEQTDRYVAIGGCDFIVDRIDPRAVSVNEPNWVAGGKGRWEIVLRYRILSPHSVGGTFSIFRSFYVPILFEKSNEFVDYVLLRRVVA